MGERSSTQNIEFTPFQLWYRDRRGGEYIFSKQFLFKKLYCSLKAFFSTKRMELFNFCKSTENSSPHPLSDRAALEIGTQIAL